MDEAGRCPVEACRAFTGSGAAPLSHRGPGGAGNNRNDDGENNNWAPSLMERNKTSQCDECANIVTTPHTSAERSMSLHVTALQCPECVFSVNLEARSQQRERRGGRAGFNASRRLTCDFSPPHVFTPQQSTSVSLPSRHIVPLHNASYRHRSYICVCVWGGGAEGGRGALKCFQALGHIGRAIISHFIT